MAPRVHILGASGSGTTTVGHALAQRLDVPHYDSDDYFWLPTSPPYRQPRPRQERLQLLEPNLQADPAWVLSGSNRGWGDPLMRYYDLVVFLLVPCEVRLERLRERERRRYGKVALEPNGVMYAAHIEFLEWAAQYDDGPVTMRSLAAHREWLSRLTCPILELRGEARVVDHLDEIERHVPAV